MSDMESALLLAMEWRGRATFGALREAIRGRVFTDDDELRGALHSLRRRGFVANSPDGVPGWCLTEWGRQARYELERLRWVHEAGGR